MAKILLAEDDPSLGHVIQDNLQINGYDTCLCDDGNKAYEKFSSSHFDICIFDVMLPKLDGFSLAKKVRAHNEDVPILFLTAKSMEYDRLEGFKSGGDDYITKPFSINELIFRIEVFLKRSKSVASSSPTIFQIGDYQFNYDNLTLINKSNSQVLTQKEAEILKCFCENQNEVLKREFILKRVWGDDDYFLGRSMDVFISKLRKYLKADSELEIANYHGVGFMFKTKSK